MQTLADTVNKSKKYLESEAVFRSYSELTKARNLGELNQQITHSLKLLGFSDYMYTQLVRADIHQPALCTISTELIRTYFDCNLFMYDMSVQKALNAPLPFFRSTIHDFVFNAPFTSDMTICMDRIYALNKHYGYYDYYHIPIKSERSNDPVMLTVTQRGTSPIGLKHNVTGHEPALTLLCESIDLVLTRHFPTLCYSGRKCTSINPKPLRVLEALANNDLTIEQVADKLKISVVTANQHLKTVRNALNTKTNYAAIKRAVVEKLIILEKPPNATMKY
ncbi:ArsR family transcriptional regulator [bacterium AH-315-K03]|nr:ArsR family transcriptional regulator [bacterium AH-315-K03]